jgi:hypothetical protein
MKYFRIEPTYKKSVIEATVFRREVEGKPQFLRKELGWRWGSFLIRVPDTDDEKLEWAKDKGYDSAQECLEDYYGHEDVDSNPDLAEYLLPESLGWTFVDCYFEICCTTTAVECDEYGSVPEEEE